jgi:hypothetical protein
MTLPIDRSTQRRTLMRAVNNEISKKMCPAAAYFKEGLVKSTQKHVRVIGVSNLYSNRVPRKHKLESFYFVHSVNRTSRQFLFKKWLGYRLCA